MSTFKKQFRKAKFNVTDGYIQLDSDNNGYDSSSNNGSSSFDASSVSNCI